MVTNDLTNIDEPTTHREMFQMIMRDIRDIKDSKTESDEALADFIDEFRKQQKLHEKKHEDIVDPALIKMGTAVKIMSWVGSVLGGGIILFILSIITGQVQIIRP